MAISDVTFLDLQLLAVQGHVGERGHPGEDLWRAVVVVVEHYQAVTGLEQHKACVAPDEASTAGNEMCLSMPHK